jgi:hypothetical protein
MTSCLFIGVGKYEYFYQNKKENWLTYDSILDMPI